MFNETTEQVKIEHRRLHPASMIFEFTKVIKETIFGFGIGLILTLKESFFYFLLFSLVFLLFLIIYSVLSWYRFTYRIENDELRIEQGVFIRKKRFISIHRIHKIDLTANILHRLLKLVKVQVDTASNSDGAEVYLSAVKLDDAEQLRKNLTRKRHVPSLEETETVYPKEKISWRRLFIAGSTSGSAGIIIIAVLTVFTQVEDLIPRKLFNIAYTWLIDLGFLLIILLVAVLLFLIWLFGIAGTMIRYGNFTIEKRKDELFIKRGLIETKELTIPYDRIQAIGIEQSLIRQPFGYVRVFAVLAGGSFDKLESFPVLFPIIHKRELENFIQHYTPMYEGKFMKEINHLPRKSLIFYLISTMILPILLSIPIIYFFPNFSWIPFIVIIISFLLGWQRYKDTGFTIDENFIIFQKRNIQKSKIVTTKQRIQAMEKKQHRLQAYADVATTTISLIGMQGFGTHYSLRHLKNEHSNEIASWYSHRKSE